MSQIFVNSPASVQANLDVLRGICDEIKLPEKLRSQIGGKFVKVDGSMNVNSKVWSVNVPTWAGTDAESGLPTEASIGVTLSWETGVDAAGTKTYGKFSGFLTCFLEGFVPEGVVASTVNQQTMGAIMGFKEFFSQEGLTKDQKSAGPSLFVDLSSGQLVLSLQLAQAMASTGRFDALGQPVKAPKWFLQFRGLLALGARIGGTGLAGSVFDSSALDGVVETHNLV